MSGKVHTSLLILRSGCAAIEIAIQSPVYQEASNIGLNFRSSNPYAFYFYYMAFFFSGHAPSLLATSSLLISTFSYFVSPNSQKSFPHNVKSNMWLFSPFVSGALAMNVVILLIGYRILNLAETHVSLALLTQNGVASDLGQGSYRFSRV